MTVLLNPYIFQYSEVLLSFIAPVSTKMFGISDHDSDVDTVIQHILNNDVMKFCVAKGPFTNTCKKETLRTFDPCKGA